MPRDEYVADVFRLRHAAERCIVVLASGLLQHPGNDRLRNRLENGNLGDKEIYRQLQLLLLQIVAWNIAERMGIVPDGHTGAKEQYSNNYSVRQMCRWAKDDNQPTGRGLLKRMQRVLCALWQGDEAIALVPWGSELFDPKCISDLNQAEIQDKTVGDLLLTISGEILGAHDSAVDPVYVGILVLGHIHEWLLELQLAINHRDWSVSLEIMPGHERRATGSYFTPPDFGE